MTAAVLLLLVAQMPDAEDPRCMFVSGPEDAFYMEPAESVSKPFARRLQWLDDGSALLIERIVPPATTPPMVIAEARQTDNLSGLMKLKPHIQLVAWSRRSRVARTLLDFDSTRTEIEELEPLPKSDQVLVSLSEHPLRPDGTEGKPVYTRALLSGSTGILRRIWSSEEPVPVRMSSSKPMGGFIFGPRDGVHKVAIFGVDGKLGNPVTLPNKGSFGYSSKGLPGVGVVELNSKGKKVYVFRLLNMQTGAVGAEAEEDMWAEPPAPALVASNHKVAGIASGVTLRVMKGRKKDGDGSDDGLVTNDGYSSAISPTNDAVAYLSGHSAYVRPLVRVDRKQYADAMLEAAKQKAMREARQMGLAMSMYAADNDDAFPPSAGDGKGVVNPYLKNRSILDGFTYTFGGGTVSGKPGETELGFMNAPGGRVVVYGDGSVKFLPDAP